MILKSFQFKKTPKGYYYIDNKRVSFDKYDYYYILCNRKDTFLSKNNYDYFRGYIVK